MPKAAKALSSGISRGATKRVGKASHLYTDDNPTTTLHGTGFKDKATANHTIELVSRRSLTYQFQTINTMLHRAKGHPHKTASMLEAIEVLQSWTSQYKSRKSELRTFKLLGKPLVEKYLKQAEEYNEAHEDNYDVIDIDFARLYIGLPAKKRLANTLEDPSHPEGRDLEVWRYEVLNELVPDVQGSGMEEDKLWLNKSMKLASALHLRMIMYGFSPCSSL